MSRWLLFGLLIGFFTSYGQSVQQFESKHSKGGYQGNQKVGIWEYYNLGSSVDLKYDHDADSAVYIRKDKSEFWLLIDGEWTLQKPDRPTTFLGSNADLYEHFGSFLKFPSSARQRNVSTKILAVLSIMPDGSFTLEEVKNRESCEECAIEVENVISTMPGKWIPAVFQNRVVQSKVMFPFVFTKDENAKFDNPENEGKIYGEIIIVGFGSGSSGMPVSNMKIIGDLLNFTTFDEAIKHYATAQVLDVSGQELTEIPVGIARLKQLRLLNLQQNKLEALPNSITKLWSLNELYLDMNNLKEFPKNMDKLKALQVISLSSNSLGSFPEFLFDIEDLRGLELSFNSLTTIPPEIKKLTNLVVLSLSHNNLTSLPDELAELKNLKTLYLDGNLLLDESEVEALRAKLPNTEIYSKITH